MNILKRLKAGVLTESAPDTETLAATLAPQVPVDHTLALYGELGIGKTTFIRGLARAWKINELVTSPTYNILAIYHGERTLVHLDAFRLESENEVEDLMIDEFLLSPYCLAIEWPDNLGNWLSNAYWKLNLQIRDDTHRFIQMV